MFTGFIYPATVHNNPEKGKLTATAEIIILLLFPIQHMQKRQTNRCVYNSRPPLYITNQPPPSKSTTSTHLFISLRTFEVNERVHARQFSKATNFLKLLCLVNILHLQIHQVTSARVEEEKESSEICVRNSPTLKSATTTTRE